MGHAAESELLEVILALGPPGGLACRLHGREQEADEDADDRDHHQEFDERETLNALRRTPLGGGHAKTPVTDRLVTRPGHTLFRPSNPQ